jgi:hypothetical protein
LKKADWLLIVLVLIGYIFGNLIGGLFPGTFLDFGGVFGLTSPVELNLGLIQLTFGLTFNITIAGVFGMILAFVIYRFIR